MLYLSVKFHQICFSSLWAIAETRFVTDRRTDWQFDFNMPPESSFGGIKNKKVTIYDLVILKLYVILIAGQKLKFLAGDWSISKVQALYWQIFLVENERKLCTMNSLKFYNFKKTWWGFKTETATCLSLPLESVKTHLNNFLQFWIISDHFYNWWIIQNYANGQTDWPDFIRF